MAGPVGHVAKAEHAMSPHVPIPDPMPDVPLPSNNDPAVVREWALATMRSFGLSDWSFGFDNARRRFGLCRYTLRRITLSKHFVPRNGPPEIWDTFLHEISHALCGPGHG